MKSWQGTIKILLKINFLTGLIALGVFVIVRGQQAVLTSTQQGESPDQLTYRGQMPAQSLDNSTAAPPPPEIVTLKQYRQLENQFKALERQILSEKSAKLDNQPPEEPQLTAQNQPKNQASPPPHPRQSVTIIIPDNSPATATPENLAPSPRSNPNSVIGKPNQSQTGLDNQQETEKNQQPESSQNPENGRVIAVNSPQLVQTTRKSPNLVNQKEPISINLVVTPPAEIDQKPRQKNLATSEKSYGLMDSKTEELIRYANDISAGLLIAGDKGQINHGTTNYRRVQTAIALLRQGEDIENAARRAQVSLDTLQQLIKWGENRPGSFTSVSTAHDSTPKNWN